MNKKLEEFKKYIKNKKVAVLGMGISNTPLIRYLASMGVDVTGFDKSEESKLKSVIDSFKDLHVKYCLGEGYLEKLKGYDVIFKTPIVRFDIPELVKAREEGAVITSEMEVFVDICPAQIFGVTGSDGKTTTTTLIYSMLKEQGYHCWLGGNIGMPLLSRIDEITESDKVVLELSSFQLHTMKKGPNVAVITNITPNHLDVHTSMEEYIEAKKNIFRYQNKDEKVVLNFDNEITRDCALEAESQVTFFSRIENLKSGAFLKNGVLVFRKDGQETEIVKAQDILIPGAHNIENYLTSIAAVADLVEPQAMKKVATTFNGVEHRIELVRELSGVKYYNSSIDSSPNRTMAALKTFRQKVILIAGGKDKNNDYEPLGEMIAEKIKCLILIGQTAPLIEEAYRQAVKKTGQGVEIPIIKCNTYDEVVKTAHDLAVPGDIVILSPASTSFDMFRNFEERGNVFKELVNKL